MKLPGWVVDNQESIRREAEDYRKLTPEQRLEILDRLCRDAWVMLAARPDRQRVLDYRDPLPASSVEALKRLRREHAAKAHHHA